jgi:hypothetical protein
MIGKTNRLEERLLTPAEVAGLLGVPVNSLKMWRYRRTGPPWLKLGRHIRYSRRDVEHWLVRQASPLSA